MKKICCIILLAGVLCSAFAELNPPHRYFEIGSDVSAGVSNNWFSVKDLFQDVLVIDFNKMSSDLNDGWDMDAVGSANVFMNLNIGNKFRLGTFVSVTASGTTNVPQNLLDFIANGNAHTPDGFSGNFDLKGAAYVEAGFSIQSFIKKLGIKVTPTVFVPAVYIPNTFASYSVVTQSDGHLKASANADLTIYSAVPLNNSSINYSEPFTGSGLDFDVQLEYGLLKSLDLGLSLRHIPAVPASMGYKMSFTASAEYTMDPLLDGTSGSKYDGSYTTTDPVYESLNTPYTVRRPVIFGVQAAYRPFGNWFALKGNADCVFDSPFYVNWGAQAGLYLLPMSKLGGHLLSVEFSTNYEEKVWVQRAVVGLNLRALEVTAHVSSRSSDFVKSFMGTGLGVGAGVRIGF